jgi:hypothetical protein
MPQLNSPTPIATKVPLLHWNCSHCDVPPKLVERIWNMQTALNQKRAVLDGIAAELRRIIGQPADKKLKLVA